MDFHNNVARSNAKSKRFYLKKAAEYVAHGQFASARKMFTCAEHCDQCDKRAYAPVVLSLLGKSLRVCKARRGALAGFVDRCD